MSATTHTVYAMQKQSTAVGKELKDGTNEFRSWSSERVMWRVKKKGHEMTVNELGQAVLYRFLGRLRAQKLWQLVKLG